MKHTANILIYASHYEHINRGCMEDLLRRTYGLNIQLTVLQCNSSIHACYLNKCLASVGSDFHKNHPSACQVCISNQSVFQHYASKLNIPCSTIVVPQASNSPRYDRNLVSLVDFCLPSIGNASLSFLLKKDQFLSAVCCELCDSVDLFIFLLRGVLGELASIRKDTSHLEVYSDLILSKLSSLFPIYRYLKSNLSFESFDYVYIF